MKHTLQILLGIYVLVTTTVVAQNNGISSAQGVGKFLNSKLPAGTPNSGGWAVKDAFPNLRFDNLTVLTAAPRTNRFHGGTRDGLIHYFNIANNTTTKTTFLDIRNKVELISDGGLLGMAFHPQFRAPNNPKNFVYLFYSAKGTPTDFLRLERYEVPAGQNHANPNSAQLLINMTLRGVLHRGGGLTFGSDGFLYLTIGDQNDLDSPQNITSAMEGGVIRIDVNSDGSKSHAIRKHLTGGGQFTGNYMIPNSNPFLDASGGTFEEYFTLGHRNPHRMSHDPVTGNLWLGEVGSNQREEVNIIAKGGNYGWPFLEGSTAGQRGQPANLIGNLVGPLVEFDRSEANAVIGGYVYRGSEHPYLQGKYLCGDYSLTKIYAIDWDGTGVASVEELTDAGPNNVTTFGIDNNGEVYICSLGSQKAIFKMTRANSTFSNPPVLLSQTGAFKLNGSGNFWGQTTLSPVDALIGYEPNTPFWSDGAEKSRWFAVPNNGSHDATNEKILFSEDDAWVFPNGSVFVKHFELPVDDRNPDVKRKVETRFMVRGNDGKYYGVTYRWRPNGVDADLLNGALEENIPITTNTGGTRTQKWKYPSRGECLTCHNNTAGPVLGMRTNQLNGDYYYQKTNTTDNQLRALNHIGLLGPRLNENQIGAMPRMVGADETSTPVQERVRSYLESNCAYCHQPGLGNITSIDARMSTPLGYQGLVRVPAYNPLGITGANVISPGNLGTSVLYQRINTLAPHRMPPLASTVLDQSGISLVRNWIQGLPQTGFPGRGLNARYYDGKGFNTFKFDRVDADINFTWGDGSPWTAQLGNDTFSVRWDGYVMADFSETYAFKVISDNGFRLWIDGQQVINRWDPNGNSIGFFTETGYKTMEAGKPVAIRAEYYEDTGGAQARILWSSASQPEQTIPASRFLRSQEIHTSPVAVGDAATVARGGQATFSIVANDQWGQGHLNYNSVVIASGPGQGSITYTRWNGKVTYTHNGGNAESDQFTYRITDSTGKVSNTATVSLSISGNGGNGNTGGNTGTGDLAFDGSLDGMSLRITDGNDNNGPIDLLELGVGADESYVYVGYRNESNVNLNNGWMMFFDTDKNASTGYRVGAIGAEYMVRDRTFYTYSGNGSSWSWTAGETVGSIINGKIVELAIPRQWMGAATAANVAFYGANKVSGGTGGDIVPAGNQVRGLSFGTSAGFAVSLDGNLGEWSGISAMKQADGADILGNTNQIDLLNLYVTQQNGQLIIGYNNEATVSWNNGWKLYLDTDERAGTGFLGNGIGADYIVQGNTLFKWNGQWSYVGSGATAVNGKGMEIMFPKAFIGGDSRFHLVFAGDNAFTPSNGVDYVPNNPGSGRLTYTGQTATGDHTGGGDGDNGGGGNTGGPVDQIVINGNLSDWPSIGTTVINDGNDVAQHQNNRIDLTELRVTNGVQKVFFAYVNAEPVGLSKGMQVYIDYDRNTNSGYGILGMGADMMIRSGNVYRYSGNNGSWGWAFLGKADVAGSGATIEYSVNRAWFLNSGSFEFAFFGDNKSQYGGTENEFAPNSFTPNAKIHVMRQ